MKHCLSDEEELLIKKAADKMRQSEKMRTVTSTGFLNETEQGILEESLLPEQGISMKFEGGYPDADRRILVFVPEYYEFEANEVITAVRCSYYKEYTLTHRDFLGAILGLGIERSMVGDINVNDAEKYTDVVLRKEMYDYISENLLKVGRAAVKTEKLPLEMIKSYVKDKEIIRETVASLRLDAVISAALGISREKSADIIRNRKVTVNRKETDQTDHILEDGSLVNVIGNGKFRLHVTDAVSRKGRTVIEIEKWGTNKRNL